jgi:hypothetical protein
VIAFSALGLQLVPPPPRGGVRVLIPVRDRHDLIFFFALTGFHAQNPKKMAKKIPKNHVPPCAKKNFFTKSRKMPVQMISTPF